jgi:hypothetical protein
MCNDADNPGSEPAGGPREEGWPTEPPPEPPGWVRRDGLTLPEAQDLLDWLEAHDIPERELTFHPAHGFSIRWHQRRRGEAPNSTSSPE